MPPPPRRVRAEIGNTSPSSASSAACWSTAAVARPAQTVDLVDRDRHRQPGPRKRSRDEPVARTDSLLAIEDQQRRVGAFELLLHPPGHARGQSVARALHARQVDQHDLAVAAAYARP